VLPVPDVLRHTSAADSIGTRLVQIVSCSCRAQGPRVANIARHLPNNGLVAFRRTRGSARRPDGRRHGDCENNDRPPAARPSAITTERPRSNTHRRNHRDHLPGQTAARIAAIIVAQPNCAARFPRLIRCLTTMSASGQPPDRCRAPDHTHKTSAAIERLDPGVGVPVSSPPITTDRVFLGGDENRSRTDHGTPRRFATTSRTAWQVLHNARGRDITLTDPRRWKFDCRYSYS